MGLFKKQSQKVSSNVDVEAKSQAFYDNFLFGDGKLVSIGNQAYAETIHETVSKADPLFADIDSANLLQQILALRVEVIGLYWLHQFGLDSAIEQSIFTQKYLHEKGLDGLWAEMDDYTQAVAASVVNQAGSSKKPAIYKMRADLADKYITQYNISDDDSETGKLQAIAKPINRKDSETAWKKDLTKYYLALTLWKKLSGGSEQKLNNEANQQLMFAIRGLYEGTADEI